MADNNDSKKAGENQEDARPTTRSGNSRPSKSSSNGEPTTDASGARVATSKDVENNEFANFSEPMKPILPKDNSGISGNVPGVDAGAAYAEDTEGVIDPKLAEAATMRPKGAQGGSQTDRLTGVQQQAQGLNRKDRPSTSGAIKVGDNMVNMAGHLQGDPADYDEADQNKGKSVIRSADNRSLFVSINGQKWEGQEIYVPNEYHKEALRILHEGGYFTKE